MTLTDLLAGRDWRVLQGDVRERLRDLPSDTFSMCVTSPPYYALRDYGTGTWEGGSLECNHFANTLVSMKSGLRNDGRVHKGPYEGEKAITHGMPYKDTCGKCGAARVDRQLGLEATPEEFIGKMVEVFREVRRVLHPMGCLFLNMGDSYAGAGYSNHANTGGAQREDGGKQKHTSPGGYKQKDLMLMSFFTAEALRRDGWYLRSVIPWHKINGMTESVKDRPTNSHEYVFLLTKSDRSFYDWWAISEPLAFDEKRKARLVYNGKSEETSTFRPGHPTGRKNKRSVWEIEAEPEFLLDFLKIATYPSPFEHFAAFPPALAEICVKAGSSEHGVCSECFSPYVRVVEPSPEYAELLKGDWSDEERDREEGRGHFLRLDGSRSPQRPVKRDAAHVTADYLSVGWEASCACNAAVRKAPILDPFFGTGTVGEVSMHLGRQCVGIDLSPKYCQIAEARITAMPYYTGKKRAKKRDGQADLWASDADAESEAA